MRWIYLMKYCISKKQRTLYSLVYLRNDKNVFKFQLYNLYSFTTIKHYVLMINKRTV